MTTSLVVRLVETPATGDRLVGEVEVVRTGERHRFRDADELVDLIRRLRRPEVAAPAGA
ncbi:MAG: hypothetical protein U0Q03_20755 [Acidimicrobiales bacterium]